MKLIQQFLSVFRVATQRLWHQRGLALSMLIGLTAAVALTVCIPVYADAISYRILNETLYQQNSTSPFSMLFRYVGSWNGYLEWEDCRQADTFLSAQTGSVLGLEVVGQARYFKTDKMRLLPLSGSAYTDSNKPLAFLSLGFVSDLESHIDILQGSWPAAITNNSEPISVLAPARLMAELGIQPGEDYRVYYEEPLPAGAQVQTVFQHTVRIAGIWQARDAQDPFWFYPQSAFEDVLLMPEASYAQMSQAMKGEVGLAVWSLVLDGRNIRTQDIEPLVRQLTRLHSQANTLLNKIEMARSPRESLTQCLDTVRLLTLSLYIFSLPTLGLVLYFVNMMGGLIVQRQRNEIAMLRSRGAATAQVIGIYALEGLTVGSAALLGGTFLGERFAQVMGLTRSFLQWTPQPLPPTTLSPTTAWPGLITLVVALAASIAPAIGASQATIVTYKQELARSLKSPWWQRAGLDFLLLIPAWYGHRLLKQRGSILSVQTPAVSGAASGAPLGDPLLFMAPVLFVMALTLLSIRVWPWLMRLLAWMSNVWRGVVLPLTFRHLSRTTRHYAGPLLLLILTVSLAVFTASMALTLDSQIADRVYYEIGADVRVIEMGQNEPEADTAPGAGLSAAQPSSQTPVWLFLPVSEHRNIPGVQAAARIWSSQITARLSSQSLKARLVGIDRVDFAETVFFRSDFVRPDEIQPGVRASLGALMNALALRNDAALVSRDVMQEFSLEIGDRVNISIPNAVVPATNLLVMGVVDLFPGIYPQDGPFFVANLDFIFDTIGAMQPYDVWLKTDTGLATTSLENEIRQMGIPVMGIYSAQDEIDRIQLRPERQGAFGLLTIGFVISAAITALGFLIYSVVSFSQRYIELGILRAVGLSVWQMSAVLIIEQSIIILSGVGIGTGLGVLTSRQFIPFLQVQGGRYPLTPPFIVQVAWHEILYIYAILAGMLLVIITILVIILRRMRIFQAIKLGETI